MPRTNRPRRAGRAPEPVPLRPAGLTRRESATDGEWLVRSVTGSEAVKDYRCPGCDQLIRAGTGHLVCWPAGEWGDVADRRHWHGGCWAARDRRGPGGRFR